MKMSTKGRYALTTMIYLAKNYDSKRYISLKEISDNENISFKYLEKIITILNKNDYLLVQRGNSGGYKLKYKPSSYNIGDILRVSEGTLAPISCVSGEKCDKKENCESYSFWEGLYNQINDYVNSKTLEDFINGGI